MGVIIYQSNDKYLGADLGNVSNFYSDRVAKTLKIIFKDKSEFTAQFNTVGDLVNGEKIFTNTLLTGKSLVYNADLAILTSTVTETTTIAGVTQQ